MNFFSKLLAVTLILTLGVNNKIHAKKLLFTCDKGIAHTCLQSTLGTANIHCTVGEEEGNADLLQLADNYLTLNKVGYKDKSTTGKLWLSSKVKEIDACLTSASLSQKIQKNDQEVATQIAELKLDESVSECTSEMDFEVSSDSEAAQASLNKAKKHIEYCSKELNVAINTNNSSDEKAIKLYLTSLKKKLEKQTDYMIWGSSINGFNMSEGLKVNDQSKTLIENIEKQVGKSSKDFLIPSWRDTALSYQFYTGVEYNNVEDLFSKSSVRVGMLTYLRLGKGVERLRDRTQGSCDIHSACGYFGWYIPHIFGSVSLTAAAESGVPVLDELGGTDTPAPDTPDTSQPNSNFDSIEYELGVFWPFYMGSRGTKDAETYQEFAVGTIASIGGRVTEDNDSFQDRAYVGFRISNNEETYFDFMVGKSQPLDGKRLELRGQIPVSKLGSGRVFIGGSINLQISKKDDSTTKEPIREPDSFKIYLTWQTTFDEIWKGFNSED